jgi:membrane peptidoglycan carboxypeptidase
MRTVSQVIRQRRKREEIQRRNPLPLLGWLLATLTSIVVTVSIFGFGWVISNLLRDLPPPQKIEPLLDSQNGSLKTPTRLLDREGKTVIASLENPAIDRLWLRRPDSPGDLPTLDLDSPLARAIIATFEPDFNQNSSFDWRDFTTPQLNTIAQRLAYDLLLWDEAEGWRKTMRAKILGEQLNQQYGKLQTLLWFLNSAKFGPLVYGAETSARLYFNKSAAELNILESAALVSILESPSIHPFNAPEVVRKRTGELMMRILKSGWIKAEEISLANLDKLNFSSAPIGFNQNQPTYVELILKQLAAHYPIEVIERGGWEIVTTIDKELQHNLECTLEIQISRLTGENEPIAAPTPDCQAALLLPGVPSTSQTSATPLQAQAIILDPSTGQVLAIASIAQDKDNPRLYRYHPLGKHTGGTVLTPFVYLAAFSRGIQPATLQWDIPPDSEAILANLNGKFHGPIRARIALANDYFAPALTLFNQIGAETVLNVVEQLGIAPELPEGASTSNLTAQQFFFSSKVSILQIAQAYQVLANQGVLSGWIQGGNSLQETAQFVPILVQKVIERNSLTSLDLNSHPNAIGKKPVISPELAYLLTNVLADEAARWQTFGHPNPFEIGRPSTAKLGRTLTPNQFWAMGYTPQRLITVWLGNEQSQEISLKPSAVMNLWHALMQYSSRGLAATDWIAPPKLVRLNVCDPSGMLPDADCPSIVNEIFIAGFEPRQTDHLFQTYLINEQTGRLATVFTPLELVKEQRFLTVPPEAQGWALAEGIPLPPKEYDRIEAPLHPSDKAQILSPKMFSYVRGVVEIIGTAGGEDFQYYRLQVGEGLFPRRWIQIGKDTSTPVKESTLGIWDTRGYNGLYTLQLQVVDKENRVETALIQLIADNTPPAVTIIFPQTGSTYSIKETPTMTFQIQGADDLGIQRVEVSLDGKKLQAFTQPPYAFPWRTNPGVHRLTVVIFDFAGNRAQAEALFTLTR